MGTLKLAPKSLKSGLPQGALRLRIPCSNPGSSSPLPRGLYTLELPGSWTKQKHVLHVLRGAGLLQHRRLLGIKRVQGDEAASVCSQTRRAPKGRLC